MNVMWCTSFLNKNSENKLNICSIGKDGEEEEEEKEEEEEEEVELKVTFAF